MGLRLTIVGTPARAPGRAAAASMRAPATEPMAATAPVSASVRPAKERTSDPARITSSPTPRLDQSTKRSKLPSVRLSPGTGAEPHSGGLSNRGNANEGAGAAGRYLTLFRRGPPSYPGPFRRLRRRNGLRAGAPPRTDLLRSRPVSAIRRFTKKPPMATATMETARKRKGTGSKETAGCTVRVTTRTAGVVV